MKTASPARPTARGRRSRSLTYAGLAGVVLVYLFSLAQASRFLPVEDDGWPIEGVVWGGIAAGCCVAAALLVYTRAFQVTIDGRDSRQG